MSVNQFLSRLKGLRRPRRLTSVLLRRLHLSQWFFVKTNGVRLRFTPSVWATILWEQPDYFHADSEILRRWLRPGDIVVDCGANIGLMTTIAARCVGDTGAVYAIEAHPRIFQWLSENVRLNAGNVVLVHAAVGERCGEILFSDGPLDDGNHVLKHGDGIRVSMRRLDDIIPQSVSTVRLLKIDVEGYEKFAIEGGERVTSLAAAIYFESSMELFGRYGYTCREFFDLLRRRGFAIVQVDDRQNRLVPASDDYVSSNIENLLALRDVAAFAEATGFNLSAENVG